MKIKNILITTTLLLIATTQLFANTNPVVTNVTFTSDGSTVTVTYKVSDADQTTVAVTMFVSEDNGITWAEKTNEASLDIGLNVTVTTTAAVKTITWPYSGLNLETMKIKILANDKTADGSPCSGTPTVTYLGKTYNTVQIADQCWLKENLDVGTRIDGVNDQTNNDGNNSIIEKYCYGDDDANCTTYGGLYQWGEAMGYAASEDGTHGTTQGICPNGWHIPTKGEYETLQSYINTEAVKLIDPNQTMDGYTATNETGFSALFAGGRFYYSGGFSYLGLTTFFWSSTQISSGGAIIMVLYNSQSDVFFYNYPPSDGMSIRCLKD